MVELCGRGELLGNGDLGWNGLSARVWRKGGTGRSSLERVDLRDL